MKAAEQFLAIDYQNALAEAKKAIDGATDKAAETKTQNTSIMDTAGRILDGSWPVRAGRKRGKA